MTLKVVSGNKKIKQKPTLSRLGRIKDLKTIDSKKDRKFLASSKIYS